LSLKRLFNTYIAGLGIISLGLLCFSPNSLAQNTGRVDVEYIDDGEDQETQDLEDSLKDYRSQQKELTDALSQMNSDGQISADEKKKLMEMYSSATGQGGKNGLPEGGKLSMEKFRPIIKQLNDQYGRMSYAAAKGQIQSNIEVTPAKPLFKAFPKMVDFVTHLIRDNQAMLGLLDMFKDKRKLLFFLAANISTILLGWILRRRVSKDAGFSEKLSKWIFRKGIVIGLRFGILMLFFKAEIYPTWLIVKKVFL